MGRRGVKLFELNRVGDRFRVFGSMEIWFGSVPFGWLDRLDWCVRLLEELRRECVCLLDEQNKRGGFGGLDYGIFGEIVLDSIIFF